MIDATLSCVRMRDLARLGRYRLPAAGKAGAREACASPRRALADASSIADASPRRPRAASSRPEADDFMASTI